MWYFASTIHIVHVVYLTNIMIVIRGQNSDTERTSCCDSITVIVALTSTKIVIRDFSMLFWAYHSPYQSVLMIDCMARCMDQGIWFPPIENETSKSLWFPVSACVLSERHFWVLRRGKGFLAEAWHGFLQVHSLSHCSYVLYCLFFRKQVLRHGFALPTCQQSHFLKGHSTNDMYHTLLPSSAKSMFTLPQSTIDRWLS